MSVRITQTSRATNITLISTHTMPIQPCHEICQTVYNHRHCHLSTNLSSSPNSRRPTLNSTLGNSSTSSLSINRSSSATTSSNSRARQSRVSSSRAPDAKVDSLVVDLIYTGDLDALGDRVSFAALDFDLGAGVVEFGLLVVGAVDGDVFAADEVFAVGLWRGGDELAWVYGRVVPRELHETYNVVGDGELDVVLLPDAPCVALQSLGVSRLAEQVLLDLEPVTATIVALD
jgi:hypothetical protein